MKIIISAALLLSMVMTSKAAPREIANDRLIVRYDDVKHTFSVADQVTGKSFLIDGKLEGDSA